MPRHIGTWKSGRSRALPVLLGAAVSLLAAHAPGAVASTGDRWVWPGPPNYEPQSPAFYDVRRGAVSFVENADGGVVWTISPDTPLTWNVSVAPGGGTPLPSIASSVYDGAGDRVIALTHRFVSDDTCCTGASRFVAAVFRLGPVPSWSSATNPRQAPVNRSGAAFAYDSRRKRLLVIGGTPNANVFPPTWTNEIDVLDLSGDSATWSASTLSPTGLPVGSAAAVYDSVTDRLVALGGVDTTGRVSQAVYSLDLGAPAAWQPWTLADTLSGSTATALPAHVDLDPVRRRLLLLHATFFGSLAGKAPGPSLAAEFVPDTTQVWALDLDSRRGWSPVPYAGRAPSIGSAQVAFDPERDRYVAFGADGRNDLLALDLDRGASWVVQARSDFVPSGGPVYAMPDTANGRVFVMSRNGASMWTLTPGASNDWEQVPPQPSTPPYHPDGMYAYDPRDRHGYVFGGGDFNIELGDLWQWTLDDSNRISWVRLFPDGASPAPRWGSAAVYDPVRHRIVLFGGWAGRVVNDTWELLLDPPIHWHRLPDRTPPPAGRYWTSAVYDSRRDAMIINGGLLGYLWDRQLTDETWVLSFADGDVWEPLTAFGRAPAPRYLHNAIYDPLRDRMIVFWGYAYNAGRIDCAELDLADGPTWRDFSASGIAPQSRGEFAAVYDAVHDAALCIGGNEGGENLAYFPPSQYVDFSADPVRTPPVLTGPPLAVLGFTPNPTRDIENVAFDLPADADVHARIYDAAGRLMRDLGRTRYVAGHHLLSWDGKNDLGEAPGSGVYFARLTMLGRDFTGKFVYLR